MLTSRLRELEAAIGENTPSLIGCLNAEISTDELRTLEVQVLPYLFPVALRELYRWHNGSSRPLELVPGFEFMPLEEALDEYRLQFEIDGGTEGWNPLWFPIMSCDGDSYCALLSRTRKTDSDVFLLSSEDTELTLAFSDIRSMLDVATEGFKSGIYRFADGYIEAEDEEFGSLADQYSGIKSQPNVDGVTSFSRHFTQKWPNEWKDAIGRTEEDYRLEGPDCTIREYINSPRTARLHLKIVGLVGMTDEAFIDVEDSSGSMTLCCPRDARGARELQIDRSYEMEVKPAVEREKYGEQFAGIVNRMILRV